MAITFIQEWSYKHGSNQTIPTESNVGTYIPVGYSYGYYVGAFKFYTDTSIQAPKIKLRAVADGTNATKYLGAYFVSCGVNDTPSSAICGSNSDTLSGKVQTRIRFGYDWNQSTSSWGSYNGSSWGSGTCTTDVKIPKGYFFVYVGAGNGTNGSWTSVFNFGTSTEYGGSVTGTAISQYTIKYDANGGSGAPSQQKKDWGVNLTLSSTTPKRTGHTFQGWATSSTATSATYAKGATYSSNASVTLYAVWKANTYTVSYNNNGYGASNMPSSQTKTYGVALTLSSKTPTLTTTTTSVTGYTVTLNPNGGTCSQPSVASTKTRTYRFYRWNTKSDGTGTNYSPGGSYTTNAAATMYLRRTFTDTNNAVTLPTPTRSGYEFIGWGTSATDTSGVTGSYTPTSAITLYALWKPLGTVEIYNSSTGKWEKYQAVIYNSSTGKWEIYMPKIYNGSNWNDVYV